MYLKKVSTVALVLFVGYGAVLHAGLCLSARDVHCSTVSFDRAYAAYLHHPFWPIQLEDDTMAELGACWARTMLQCY